MDHKLVKMKFLVTGSAGLVGRHLTKELAQEHTTFSAYYNDVPEYGIPIKIDLADCTSIINAINDSKPDVIFHLAAMTGVDTCESQKELAEKINHIATQTIAKESAKINAFLVYVSTDYVFDGKAGLYKESDPANPVGVYGKTKLQGETTVINNAVRWCIARTSTPFGIHPTKKSFPIWVAQNLKANQQISIVTDQFTSPTFVPNLCQMLIEIAQRQITGIIHVAGATRISRFELANMVADRLRLNKQLITPILTYQLDWKAQRPLDSSLDITKANTILINKPMTIHRSLDLLIKQIT